MHCWLIIILVTIATSSITSCRFRRESSDTLAAESTARMKLFATCVSDSPASRYRNVIVQEDAANLKGLLTLDIGEAGTENQVIKSTNMVVENRDATEIRKTYSGKDLTFWIDLDRKNSDTFAAKLKESDSPSEIAYHCAI